MQVILSTEMQISRASGLQSWPRIDPLCIHLQVHFSIPYLPINALGLGLFLGTSCIILLASSVDDLNKIFDTCSFYICMRVIILHFQNFIL